MASVFVKNGKLWARIKKPGGRWQGYPTEFAPNQKALALERAAQLQREVNPAALYPVRATLVDDLYVILSSCGHVKIGRAVNCEQRLRTLMLPRAWSSSA